MPGSAGAAPAAPAEAAEAARAGRWSGTADCNRDGRCQEEQDPADLAGRGLRLALLVSDWGVAAWRNDLPSYFHLAFASCPTQPRLPPRGRPAIGLGDCGKRSRGLPTREGVDTWTADWLTGWVDGWVGGWMQEHGLDLVVLGKLGDLDRGWVSAVAGGGALPVGPDHSRLASADPCHPCCLCDPGTPAPVPAPAPCAPAPFVSAYVIGPLIRAGSFVIGGACVGSSARGQSKGRL